MRPNIDFRIDLLGIRCYCSTKRLTAHFHQTVTMNAWYRCSRATKLYNTFFPLKCSLLLGMNGFSPSNRCAWCIKPLALCTKDLLLSNKNADKIANSEANKTASNLIIFWKRPKLNNSLIWVNSKDLLAFFPHFQSNFAPHSLIEQTSSFSMTFLVSMTKEDEIVLPQKEEKQTIIESFQLISD